MLPQHQPQFFFFTAVPEYSRDKRQDVGQTVKSTLKAITLSRRFQTAASQIGSVPRPKDASDPHSQSTRIRIFEGPQGVKSN